MRHKFQISSLYKGNLFKSISDRRLVRKAKKGNKDAYGKLYLKHLDSIYRYIFFRVGQNTHEAEDLTEIVFFKAWEKIDNFNEKGYGFRAWIYKIAHNLVIDYYRDIKRLTSLDEGIPYEGKGIEEKAIEDFEKDALMKAIEKLSSEQKEVITMKYIEGFSNKEIGKVLNKGDDAVRALKSRALKKLRKLLSQND